MARKETAFPLWRASDSRWKRNMVSLVSSVTELMRLPEIFAIKLIIIIIIIIFIPPVVKIPGVENKKG